MYKQPGCSIPCPYLSQGWHLSEQIGEISCHLAVAVKEEPNPLALELHCCGLDTLIFRWVTTMIAFQYFMFQMINRVCYQFPCVWEEGCFPYQAFLGIPTRCPTIQLSSCSIVCVCFYVITIFFHKNIKYRTCVHKGICLAKKWLLCTF